MREGRTSWSSSSSLFITDESSCVEIDLAESALEAFWSGEVRSRTERKLGRSEQARRRTRTSSMSVDDILCNHLIASSNFDILNRSSILYVDVLSISCPLSETLHPSITTQPSQTLPPHALPLPSFNPPLHSRNSRSHNSLWQSHKVHIKQAFRSRLLAVHHDSHLLYHMLKSRIFVANMCETGQKSG